MSRLFIDDGLPANGTKKVMLATPVYQNTDASYTFAMSKSRMALQEAGINSAYLLFSGNCHCDDSRNKIVQEFLASDCTDLVFLDADVSWDEKDLVSLCGYNFPVVGGVYGYRREGTAESMPYRSKEGATIDNGLIEVEGLPTGFMKIRRHVLQKIADESPFFYQKNDNVNKIPLIFERTLVDGVRWGGDLNFCNKVRKHGWQIMACTEFRLGHVGVYASQDSLGAFIRRTEGTTINHVSNLIKEGKERHRDLTEALDYIGNPWGANLEILMIAIAAARKADGPIIETGSGLSTVLMAAATDQTVFAIEHDDFYADKLKQLAAQAGVNNIAIVRCSIKDGWYDIEEDLKVLPERFAVGLNDGPPRTLGDRMKFFDVLGDKVDFIIADDADHKGYADQLTEWANTSNRDIVFPQHRSAVIKEAA